MLLTINVPVVVVAVPCELVNVALKILPVSVKAVVKLSVGEVAPGTLLKVAPPLVLTNHWTVGAGWPVAAAVNVAVDPAATVWLTGFVVTVGAKFTVIVAAVVVADPLALVNTARNFVPFCPAATFGTVSVAVIAPATFWNVAPPSVENCHCTVGVGNPVAAAVNVAVWPAFTVESVGFVVTTGPAVTVSVAAVVVAEPTELVNTARY